MTADREAGREISDIDRRLGELHEFLRRAKAGGGGGAGGGGSPLPPPPGPVLPIARSREGSLNEGSSSTILGQEGRQRELPLRPRPLSPGVVSHSVLRADEVENDDEDEDDELGLVHGRRRRRRGSSDGGVGGRAGGFVENLDVVKTGSGDENDVFGEEDGGR